MLHFLDDTNLPPLTGDGTDGFPSREDFTAQMEDYLAGLNPKKRAKALMTEDMYATILSVLLEPHSTAFSTAQFRFWSKRMFRLVTTPHANIVTHENRPVAVKDQIYNILVGCHGDAGHGGRDKTSAQVRRFYSWIPKELVSRFVKMCPECAVKRRNARPVWSDWEEGGIFTGAGTGGGGVAGVGEGGADDEFEEALPHGAVGGVEEQQGLAEGTDIFSYDSTSTQPLLQPHFNSQAHHRHHQQLELSSRPSTSYSLASDGHLSSPTRAAAAPDGGLQTLYYTDEPITVYDGQAAEDYTWLTGGGAATLEAAVDAVQQYELPPQLSIDATFEHVPQQEQYYQQEPYLVQDDLVGEETPELQYTGNAVDGSTAYAHDGRFSQQGQFQYIESAQQYEESLPLNLDFTFDNSWLTAAIPTSSDHSTNVVDAPPQLYLSLPPDPLEPPHSTPSDQLHFRRGQPKPPPLDLGRVSNLFSTMEGLRLSSAGLVPPTRSDDAGCRGLGPYSAPPELLSYGQQLQGYEQFEVGADEQGPPLTSSSSLDSESTGGMPRTPVDRIEMHPLHDVQGFGFDLGGGGGSSLAVEQTLSEDWQQSSKDLAAAIQSLLEANSLNPVAHGSHKSSYPLTTTSTSFPQPTYPLDVLGTPERARTRTRTLSANLGVYHHSMSQERRGSACLASELEKTVLRTPRREDSRFSPY